MDQNLVTAWILYYRIYLYILTIFAYSDELLTYLKNLIIYKQKSIFNKNPVFKNRRKSVIKKLGIKPAFLDLVNKEYSFHFTLNERREYAYAVPYGNADDPLLPRLNFSPTVEPFIRTPLELTDEECRRSFDDFRWTQERCGGWADCELGTRHAGPHYADDDSIVLRRRQIERTHPEAERGNAEDARGIGSRNQEGYIGRFSEPDLTHHCKMDIATGNRSRMFFLRNRKVQAEIVGVTQRAITVRFRIVRQNYVHAQYCFAVMNINVGVPYTFAYLGVKFTIAVRGYPRYLWMDIRNNN